MNDLLDALRHITGAAHVFTDGDLLADDQRARFFATSPQLGDAAGGADPTPAQLPDGAAPP